MPDGRQRSAQNWRGALAVVLVVLTLSFVGLALLGSQTSRSSRRSAQPSAHRVSEPSRCPTAIRLRARTKAPATNADGRTPDDGSTGLAALQDASRPDLLIIRRGSITIQVVPTSTPRWLLPEAHHVARAATKAAPSARARVTRRTPRSSTASPRRAGRPRSSPIRAVGENVLDERVRDERRHRGGRRHRGPHPEPRVTERAFQSIMDRATEIRDVLDVQAQLATVRSEIEQLSSKAAHLREQAAMSTLSVMISSCPTPAVARQEARFDPAGEAEAATAQPRGHPPGGRRRPGSGSRSSGCRARRAGDRRRRELAGRPSRAPGVGLSRRSRRRRRLRSPQANLDREPTNAL